LQGGTLAILERISYTLLFNLRKKIFGFRTSSFSGKAGDIPNRQMNES
jgi:hypothetical protein